MKEEEKKQIILCLILLVLVIGTLFFWYPNFIFHSYLKTHSYQYSFSGSNQEFRLDHYEFSQNNDKTFYGNARLTCFDNSTVMMSDKVKITFQVDKQVYSHDLTFQNQVAFIPIQECDEAVDQSSLIKSVFQIEVVRGNKSIYKKEIPLKQDEIITYNGANKDYAISDVFASSRWLKIGMISSTLQNIEKDYPYMTIDYLYSPDNQTSDINHLERFAIVKGKTSDLLNQHSSQVVYYDKADSLLEHSLYCVVTLAQNEKREHPFTFAIELRGNIKVGE